MEHVTSYCMHCTAHSFMNEMSGEKVGQHYWGKFQIRPVGIILDEVSKLLVLLFPAGG